MQKFEDLLFMPAVLVDARGSEMKPIMGSLLSVINQTMCPPQIRIMVDSKTMLNFDTVKDVICSRDGANITVSYQMNIDSINEIKRTNDDVEMLRAIKWFKYVHAIHKVTKKKVKFPITHVVSLISGHGFQSTTVLQRLSEDWKSGRLYDLMFFKKSHGSSPISSKSCVFYLSSVKLMCSFHLWKPFIDKHRAFQCNINKVKKDINFIPIRTCKYGVMESF